MFRFGWPRRLHAARAALALGLVPLFGSGCTRNLTEAQMFRLRPGDSLTAALVSTHTPTMSLTPIEIVSLDGTHLRGGLLTQPGARETIIYFGGNIATVARTGLRTARRLAPLGSNVVLVDYRGYGASDAVPASADALLDDGLRVFDHVRSIPGLETTRLVVHGHSMGSLVAAHVAASRPVAAVVLESAAPTTDAYVANQIPWYATPFVRVRVAPSLRAHASLRLMPAIGAPMLLLVGARDRDTPTRFSRSLYDASPLPAARKLLVEVPDADHSDVLEHPESLSAYRRFLRDVVDPHDERGLSGHSARKLRLPAHLDGSDSGTARRDVLLELPPQGVAHPAIRWTGQHDVQTGRGDILG